MNDLLSGALGGAKSEASLQRELVLGFELEHKRKAEDDMKKRAIRTAGSYDEFKNLVAAATQKPIEARDYGGRALTSMNKGLGPGEAAAAAGGGGGGSGGRANSLGLAFPEPLPAEAAAAAAAAAAAGAGAGAGAPAPALRPAAGAGFGLPPNTPGEFERTWRRVEAARRPAYLAWLQPQRLGHAFRIDIDGSMLGAIVSVLGAGVAGALSEEWAGQGGEEAVRARLQLAAGLLLAAPPSALGLAVDTLSREEKAAAARLADAAQRLGCQAEALALLVT